MKFSHRLALLPVVALAGAAVIVPMGTATAAGTAAGRVTSQAAKPAATTVKPAAQAATATKSRYTPPANYAMPAGQYFSFPNRGKALQQQIHNRVLATVRSVWGGPRDRYHSSISGGTIRMATWSFNDMAMAKALVAAYRRGVSVQVVAAKSANKTSHAWHYLQSVLGTRLNYPKHPETIDRYSFARACTGACRGKYGTAHAKYYLFDNVGRWHVRNITVQSSMNLTTFAYKGQWNQAQVQHDADIYNDFLTVFKQSRLNVSVKYPYRAYGSKEGFTSYFFPLPGGKASVDPMMVHGLNNINCSGAVGQTGGRTVVRIDQYAIYGTRGLYLAKKIRQLWNAGCDVKIIYSVSSVNVKKILLAKSGRGRVPMRQSVTKNGAGVIEKYNHSKWMTVSGHYGSNTKAYVVWSGSSNWTDYPFASDEQIQEQNATYAVVKAFRANFLTTWNQKTSKPATLAPQPLGDGGRMILSAADNNVPLGKGIYKNMAND